MRKFITVEAPNDKCEWADKFPGEVVIIKKGKDIENIGMEVYGMLWWIVNNYDNLPDQMIFAHPDVLKHVPQFFDRISKIKNDGMVPLGGWMLDHYNGVPHHFKEIDIWGVAKELDLPIHNDYWFTPGATFSVDRRTVLKRPKEFYERCVDIITRKNEMCGDEVYIFERLWGHIFG